MKGTWQQALRAFFFPILLIVVVRWFVVEPFVIPSGSMIPSLLIHDHILVKKFLFGLKVPLIDRWLYMWQSPERGQIVVFKYPPNPDVYYIKRLIGLPGDQVKITSGKIEVNGVVWALAPLQVDESEIGFLYFKESVSGTEPVRSHIVRFLSFVGDDSDVKTYTVPEGQYFFMGDNRDQSSDSRYWGFVDKKYLVGPAWLIWLSCENTLSSTPFLCDPTQIRWSRMFKSVD